MSLSELTSFWYNDVATIHEVNISALKYLCQEVAKHCEDREFLWIMESELQMF